MPELQKRGAYPTAYRPGTLREKLFGAGSLLPKTIRPTAPRQSRLSSGRTKPPSWRAQGPALSKGGGWRTRGGKPSARTRADRQDRLAVSFRSLMKFKKPSPYSPGQTNFLQNYKKYRFKY